jgi:hypothetical protein
VKAYAGGRKGSYTEKDHYGWNNMQIQSSKVDKLTITGAERLDPIHVFLEDIEPSKGRVTIACYGQAWSAYWGGMAGRTVAEFIGDMATPYLAKYFTDVETSVFDSEALEEAAKAGVEEKFGMGRLSGDEREELLAEIEHLPQPMAEEDMWEHSQLFERILGEDWHRNLPTKVNSDFNYLCRIVNAMKDALSLRTATA